MKYSNSKKVQILKEKQNISKYTGLLCGRIFLLFCLFALLAVLQPAPFYIFIFLLLCPWVLSTIASSRQKPQKILLSFCAKKFYYTPIKLAIEKHIGNCIIILLAVWQIVFPPFNESFSIIRQAPAFLLLLYLICRIAATIITRQMIHHIYTKLILLD